MRIYLKVKIKSLSAEASIIRREERRFAEKKHPIRRSLHHHRKTAVRREARDALLAYGFLRGRRLDRIEAKCHRQPDWKNVQRMVERYSVGDAPAWAQDRVELLRKFGEWRTR
jgi:hypothetical protein